MNIKDKKSILQYRIKELEGILDSLDLTNAIHSIEIDLLLSKIRLIYEDVKRLEVTEVHADDAIPEVPPVFDEQEVVHPQKESIVTEREVFDDSQTGPLVEEKAEDLLPHKEVEPEKLQVEKEGSSKQTGQEEMLVEKPTIHNSPKESLEFQDKVENIVNEDSDTSEPYSSVNGKAETLEREVESMSGDNHPAQDENYKIPDIKPDQIIKANTTLLKEPKEKLLTGIRMQAVSDIMVAIGLNDRFLFIRELFNNDSEKFKSTIEALNNQPSWNEAVNYLNDEFDWNPEDPTLILFLSFVKRRFL